MCGFDPQDGEAGLTRRGRRPGRPPSGRSRGRNYERVARRSSPPGRQDARAGSRAKRLLPEAAAAGYAGSARNFRRLVAQAKPLWRRGHHRGRRPAVWSPGDTLVIDWGVQAGCTCSARCWRGRGVRFVRFADDERADTTLAMLAECFETLGGVPKVVLADRMGCLKGGVVANVVIPTPDYVRFATHYRFRPGLLPGAATRSRRGSWRTSSATPSPT